MGADIVRIPPTQSHFDVDGFHIGRDVLDANARAEKRRPKVDPAAEMLGSVATAKKLKENASAVHAGSRLRSNGDAAAVDRFEDFIRPAREKCFSRFVAQSYGMVAVARIAQ